MAYHFNINKTHKGNPDFNLSLNITIEDGEHVAIMGESGGGKSTAMNVIQQQLLDENIVFRKVFQDENSALYPHLDVMDNLTIGAVLGNTGMSKADAEAEAKQWLAKVGIDERLWDKRPHQLSGGQRQRVGIARSLVGGAKFIIMDEPTSGLDKVTKMEVVETLKTLKTLGVTILLVTHDPEECEAFASRVIRLKPTYNEVSKCIESRIVSDITK